MPATAFSMTAAMPAGMAFFRPIATNQSDRSGSAGGFRKGPVGNGWRRPLAAGLPRRVVLTPPALAKAKRGQGLRLVIPRRGCRGILTLEDRGWVQGNACNHKTPFPKAEKGVSNEDAVRPFLRPMKRRSQYGVYRTFTSIEMGSTFTPRLPQFPAEGLGRSHDPSHPSRYLHYHFHAAIQWLRLWPWHSC